MDSGQKTGEATWRRESIKLAMFCYLSLWSQWIWMSNSEIWINLPLKKFGSYALCIFYFLSPEYGGHGQVTDSTFQSWVISSCMRGLPTTQGIWPAYDMAGKHAGLTLGSAENWAQRTLSTKASLFRSHYWQSSKLLFCESWGNYNWFSVPWWTQ